MVPTRPAAGARHHLSVLSSGEKNLKGTSFYLDSVKSRLAAVLVEAISNLGGVVEGFLNKDISCVVTGNQEWFKGLRSEASREGSDGMRVEAASSSHPSKWREEILSINSAGQRPSTPRPMVCGSRGKALLEKAMRNNHRLHGSSVLANARSWGVEIVHVDDFLTFVHRLKEVNAKVKHRRPEQRNANKCPTTRIVKAVALKSPFLKVEDSCRKYKPLYLQSLVFPTLYNSGSRFSPFEPPPPPQPGRVKEPGQNTTRESKSKKLSSTEHKPPSPLLRTPSLSCVPPARRKNLGYCECCHEPFKDQDEHLQSEQHRGFVQESSHYSVMDQLVVDMQPGFDPDPAPEPTATLMSVASPQSLIPPNSPDLEHDTPSETEQAIQTLLTPGSPSCILAESPTPVTRPASPSMATKPPDTGPPPSHPDTLCQQPHSPYSQPPPLSPQCMDPHYLEPHNLYSEPPVLSPQRPLIETDVMLSDESHLDHQTALLASYQPPTPLPTLGCVHPAVAVRGPDHDRLPVGDGCLTRGRTHSSGSGGVRIIRSCSLLQVCNTKHNPRKRCRSASPDRNANKRRRTSLIRCQRSDLSHGFSSSWTTQEATCFISSTHEPLIKASWNARKECGAAVHKPIVEELYGNRSSAVTAHTQVHIDPGRSAASHQSVFGCGLANQNCPAVMGDKITNSLPREEQGTKGPTFLLPCATYFTQTPKQIVPSTLGNRNSSTDTHIGQQKCPDASNTKCFSPRDKTLWPPSSQSSHPSLSQSFSSVCIESALIPDMATPSSSDSDWDCGFVSRLGPAPAAPLPSTGGSCGLDMEVLQRPCTWMHNTSYNSHLCSVLQPPISPPSLCGDESAPLTFIRTVMQSVVQH